MRGITLFIVVLGAIAMALFTVIETTGEKVTLRTWDESDVGFESRVWIVDTAQFMYLRANSEKTDWYQRILANPVVEIERDGKTIRCRALVLSSPIETQEVDDLMAEKYQIADELAALVYRRTNPVAIRLDTDLDW